MGNVNPLQSINYFECFEDKVNLLKTQSNSVNEDAQVVDASIHYIAERIFTPSVQKRYDLDELVKIIPEKYRERVLQQTEGSPVEIKTDHIAKQIICQESQGRVYNQENRGQNACASIVLRSIFHHLLGGVFDDSAGMYQMIDLGVKDHKLASYGNTKQMTEAILSDPNHSLSNKVKTVPFSQKKAMGVMNPEFVWGDVDELTINVEQGVTGAMELLNQHQGEGSVCGVITYAGGTYGVFFDAEGKPSFVDPHGSGDDGASVLSFKDMKHMNAYFSEKFSRPRMRMKGKLAQRKRLLGLWNDQLAKKLNGEDVKGPSIEQLQKKIEGLKRQINVDQRKVDSPAEGVYTFRMVALSDALVPGPETLKEEYGEYYSGYFNQLEGMYQKEGIHLREKVTVAAAQPSEAIKVADIEKPPPIEVVVIPDDKPAEIEDDFVFIEKSQEPAPQVAKKKPGFWKRGRVRRVVSWPFRKIGRWFS